MSVKKIQDPLAEVQDKLLEEIKDYADVFIERPIGQLPIRKPWDHCMDLKEGFISQKGRIILLPAEDVQKIKEFIEENVKKGFIRPSKSPQTAPIFFIPKKDTSEKRMIMDYGYLNLSTITNTYLVPNQKVLLDKLAWCDNFTKLDLS